MNSIYFYSVPIQIASGRLTHQHADGEDGAPSAKKRRVTKRIERPKGVAAQFKQVDASKLEQVKPHGY